MANEIKLPEETLMRLGFRLLDITYGELTIWDGEYYDEVFVDKDGEGRLGYDFPQLGINTHSFLSYLYKDKEFFLSIIPAADVDYQRVLKAWMLEHYKREAVTSSGSLPFALSMAQHH